MRGTDVRLHHRIAPEPRPQQHHQPQTEEQRDKSTQSQDPETLSDLPGHWLLFARRDRAHDSTPATIAHQIERAFAVALPQRERTRYVAARVLLERIIRN